MTPEQRFEMLKLLVQLYCEENAYPGLPVDEDVEYSLEELEEDAKVASQNIVRVLNALDTEFTEI